MDEFEQVVVEEEWEKGRFPTPEEEPDDDDGDDTDTGAPPTKPGN